MINRVILVGYVGQAPEVKQFPNGTQYATFTVATSKSYKDASGEWVSHTTWHNISARTEGTVNYVCKHVEKGALVYLEGSIEMSKSGDKTYCNIVVAGANSRVHVLKPAQSTDTHVNMKHELNDDIGF